MIIKERFERVEPFLSPRSERFWRAGAGGVLQIARCQSCGRYRHPPRPVCDACRGGDLQFEDVSGRGTLWSWTLNRYAWQPTMPPPYVVAVVELAEQPGLRLMSNLVNCDVADIRIGMDVQVCFAPAGASFVPLFMPMTSDGLR
jgi:uncharacterized OB-fold protein